MSDADDRFYGKQGGGGLLFLLGLVTGTALGVGLGMLFAPKSGSALRRQISRRAGALANQAQDGYRTATDSVGQWAEAGKEAAGELAESGKDMYGKARKAVSRGVAEAQKFVRDAGT
jgi:gas vesicle protein